MTICEAIKQVMTEHGDMTSKEAYRWIVEEKLYVFGAKNPEGVVNSEIRCHCIGIDFLSASPVKHFIVVGQKDSKNCIMWLHNKAINFKRLQLK